MLGLWPTSLLTGFFAVVMMTSKFSCLQIFRFTAVYKSSPHSILTSFNRKMSSNIVDLKTEDILSRFRRLVPPLDGSKHKGEAGRIGVIGGSLEYTGAPYFAAMTALKLGADLVHVFCQREAAPVIKAYSPELIVHPILDSNKAVHEILQWSERLHALVIGPGLGRDDRVLQTVADLIKIFQKNEKPIVIDADGLHMITVHKTLLKPSLTTVLTPNAIEFKRLFGDVPENSPKPFELGVTIMKKGESDCIYATQNSKIVMCPPGGSGRRCGGQGDLLSGSLALFLYWAIQANEQNPALMAAAAASVMTKSCNAAAFKKHGRSMLASDMINELHNVFEKNFEFRQEK